MGQIMQLISKWYNLLLGFWQTNKTYRYVRRYGIDKVADLLAYSQAGNFVDALTAIIIKRNVAMNIDMRPQETQKIVELILRQLFLYEHCKNHSSLLGKLYRIIWSRNTQHKLVTIKQISLMVTVKDTE